MSRAYTVALVGGGSIATSVLAQLARRVDRLPTLHLLQFEPAPRVGVGQPYAQDLDSVLLNTQAAALSVLPAEPDHFLDWLRGRAERRTEDARWLDGPVPRAVYGDYLADTHRHAVAALRACQVPVSLINEAVVDMAGTDYGAVVLRTERGLRFTADEALLCIGNLPSLQFRALEGVPGYLSSPYPCREMIRSLGDANHVGIAGTSLSALDAIASLHDSGFRRQITAFSRRGHLPSVRSAASSPVKLRHFTRDGIDGLPRDADGCVRLHGLVELLRRDIEARTGAPFRWEEALAVGTTPAEYLANEIEVASRGERHWQSVLYQANEVVDYAWHRLSLRDRREFDERYRHQFMVRRIAVPLVNAKKVLTMLQRGQLSVLSDVSTVRAGGSGGFDIEFRASATERHSPLHVDRLVNATGMCVDVTRADDGLIHKLVTRGLMSPSEFGGVRQHFGDLRLKGRDEADGDGAPAPSCRTPVISLLGSLGGGTCFWTNAMSVNSRLAGRVVDAIQRRAVVALAPASLASYQAPPVLA